MRKYNLFLSLLMVMLLSVGNVWAVDYELVYTLDGTVTTGGNSNYAQDGGGLTQNNIDWSVTGNTTINPWRIGGKNLTNEDRLVYSKTAISDNIAKIEIEQGTINLTVNSVSVIVASNSDFSTVISSFTPTSEANKTITITRPDGKDWSNCYYKIVYNVTAGSSNTYVQLKSIKFYKEASGEEPGGGSDPVAVTGVSLDKSEISLEVGETQTLTATVAPADATNKSVTWTSNNENVAKVSNAGVVTAVGVGNATITVTTTDGNKTATCDVEVVAASPKSSLTFTAKCNGSGTADDGAKWTITSDGTESNFDNTKGIHYGTSSAAVGWVQLLTSDIHGTIKKVVVNASGASGTSATISVKVGTTDFNIYEDKTSSPISATATDFEFTGSASGQILVLISQTSAKKAIYCKSIVVSYESDGKESAGLAYADADLSKLVKLGDEFTTPTLTNPHNLAVSYESSNSEVVEVASNGAVTVKAVGVAEITASFAGNDDYNAGSASYTIGVTSHAGTEIDPYDAADAKIAIDVKGTVENAYATGIVSNITTTTLPQEGYITFYFSADGLTSGQQIEAYKCYGLNSAPFEALTDVKTGATVVITGTLKKFNSTYEFDQNCHLVSYEAPAVPKTHIANDQANPYTVAQAIAYAADGVTYDLDDYVYVQGVVYDVKSFSNGAMNIFIKDANAENEFELYKCAGINDGSSTTPFDALSDVQVGNIVIGYGQLTVYNNVYEFKQGNYLVDLDRPEVAVTSVELGATATVKVGNVINLSASVLPANATDQAIEWSIQSGNDKITLENGTVTGVAEGEAVVRAASHADNTKYAECTITITAANPTYLYYNYEKVTATADIIDGEYLIVYESENVAFNGGLATLDAANNSIAVEINDGLIVSNTTTDAAAFTIDVTAGTLRAAMGDYIGVTSYGNGLKQNANSATYTAHSFSIDGDGNAIISLNNNWEASMILNYNTGASDKRFRYYKNGSQKKIQLYKKVGTNETPKLEAGLAWNPADDIELTVGDAFTAPTLSNPNNIAADEIEITSSNTSLATVTAGVVSLVENATGEATITATFAGNDNYKAAIVSYNITVNSSAPTPTSTIYHKVTATADITDGEYLIVYEGDATHDAAVFDGSLDNDNIDVAKKVLAVEIENDEIVGSTDLDAAVFTIDVTAGSLQSASGLYIGRTANSNGMDKSTTEAYVNTFAITDGAAVITGAGGCTLRYNYASDQLRFRYYKSGQQAIQLYKKESVEPVEPELNYVEARTELTVGKFYTICMPRNILGVRGATFWNLNNRDESGSMVYFVEAEAPFDAGKPYIFIATAETLEVAYGEDVADSPVANGALRGTFSAMTQSDFDAISAANSSSPIYMLVDNQLRQVAGRSGNSLGANRAYVIYNELQAGEPTPAPGRRVLAMPMNENVATGIDALGSDAQPSKIIVNGQLFIIRDGKAYDATGRQVSKF